MPLVFSIEYRLGIAVDNNHKCHVIQQIYDLASLILSVPHRFTVYLRKLQSKVRNKSNHQPLV